MKAATAAKPQVINLDEKFAKFIKTFTPHVVADVNDFWVLLAKLDGEFVEHRHDAEDELFLVVKGQLTIRMKDQTVTLNPGEIFVVPQGVDHKPSAKKGTQVLLLEKKSTRHTGAKETAQTVSKYQRI